MILTVQKGNKLLVVQLDLPLVAENRNAVLGLRDSAVLAHLEQDLSSLHELAFESQRLPHVIGGHRYLSRQYH